MGRRRLYCATLRARRTKRLDQRPRDRDETLLVLETVSRPRPRDREHIPDLLTGGVSSSEPVPARGGVPVFVEASVVDAGEHVNDMSLRVGGERCRVSINELTQSVHRSTARSSTARSSTGRSSTARSSTGRRRLIVMSQSRCIDTAHRRHRPRVQLTHTHTHTPHALYSVRCCG